jgi:hypothetical protein
MTLLNIILVFFNLQLVIDFRNIAIPKYAKKDTPATNTAFVLCRRTVTQSSTNCKIEL